MNWDKLRLPYREDTAFGFLAFCVFLLPLVFSLYSYENFESVKFGIFLILTGLSGAVFFLRQPAGTAARASNKYFNYLLCLFGFWAALSSIFAQDKFYAFFGFYYRYTSGLVFYAVLGLFIYLLFNLLDEERLKYLLKILVLDALVVAVIAYLQSFGWIFYAGLSIDGFFHGPSLLGNINYSAMFLACTLPFTFYFFHQSPGKGAKIYYSVTAFFIIFGMFLLASRGALLAVAASLFTALALFGFCRFPKKFFYYLLALTAAVFILGFFLLNASRPQAISSITSIVDPNTTDRLYAWGVSLKGIAQHPWLGSGPGNYELFFQNNLPVGAANQIGIFDDAHNIFLQLGVTGGLPLVLFFAGLILTAFFYGLKELKEKNDLFVLALISSLAAWAVSACFNPVPIPMFMLLAVILAGLMFNHLSKKEINFALWKKITMVFFALVIFIFGLTGIFSEHLLGLARDAYSSQDYVQSQRLAALAWTINPTNELALVYKATSEIYIGASSEEIQNEAGKIIKLHPNQAQEYTYASNLFALLYGKTGDSKDLNLAISYMESSLKIDPLFADRYGQLAIYYYQAGNFEKSQANIEKNLSMDSGNFSGWILLAKLYQMQNKKQAVIYALTKAFNINPDIPQLKYLLFLAKNLPDVQKVPIEFQAQPPSI